jgi:phenylpropionate dioxygenase-like ring-hydroxylating dioxygenase large terminal subunit
MLSTRQAVLRKFWYATVPMDSLRDGPKPFTLLGVNIVVFLGADDKPAALADRCCHRTAKLSKGWVKDGHIVCAYHGWSYDTSGKLAAIPQFPPEQPLPEGRATAYHAKERYGYVWVALEEPLLPIPVLDGGHLVFHVYEAVFRRPPNQRVMQVLMTAGLAILLSLMVFAFSNDLFLCA